MEEENLYAIKSSNHRDRTGTSTEFRTERAFHLIRFLGTEQDKTPPPFEAQPRVRRELVPPPQITEEDKRAGYDKPERKPGETQEAFEIRTRFRNRKKGDEWKWTFENGARARWDGKEDTTQSSNYVVIIPPTDPSQPYKVAMIDHWIEARKFVDNSAQKKKMKDELLRKKLKMASRKNQMEAEKVEEDLQYRDIKGFDLARKRKEKNFTWVEGRDDDDVRASKKYRKTGIIDEDEDEEGGGGNGGGGEREEGRDGEGVKVEDLEFEDNKIDHEHGLAIDRVQEDGDEFQQDDYNFDDDDEGVTEAIQGEGFDGLEEGVEAITTATALDAEEIESDEEEGMISRSNSPNSSDEEEEGDSQATTRTPMLMKEEKKALDAPAARVQPQKALSLQEQMRNFIIDAVRTTNNGRIAGLIGLVGAARDHFGTSFDKKEFRFAIEFCLNPGKDEILGAYFTLKDGIL